MDVGAIRPLVDYLGELKYWRQVKKPDAFSFLSNLFRNRTNCLFCLWVRARRFRDLGFRVGKVVSVAFVGECL